MNDRFRFRAVDNRDWSDEKGTIYYDAEQTYDYLGGTPAVPDNSFGSLLDEEFPGWIVEQCTGVKDETGKLIYEGDIVECFFEYFDGNFSEKRVVGPVVWYAASWKVKEKGNHWDLVDAGFDEKNLQSDYVKIIGNIHENPELLQEK